MPYVAIRIDGETKERIDISAVENPLELRTGRYVCQLCEAEMICKIGMVKQAHFAHKSQCTSDYQAHPESWEHRLTKLYLMNNLKNLFPIYANTKPEQEVVMRDIKRVADIVFTFPNGWRVVHEVQLSPITKADLIQRTRDYESIGCDTIWWLGGRANSEENRQWVIQHQQVCFELSYEPVSRKGELFSGDI